MEVAPSPLTLLILMRIIFPSCRQMEMLPYLFFCLLSPIFGLLDSEPHRVARFNNILSKNWSDCDCEVFNEKIRKLTYIAIDRSHHADVYFFEKLLTLVRRLFQQEEAVINLVEDLANFNWVTVNLNPIDSANQTRLLLPWCGWKLQTCPGCKQNTQNIQHLK